MAIIYIKLLEEGAFLLANAAKRFDEIYYYHRSTDRLMPVFNGRYFSTRFETRIDKIYHELRVKDEEGDVKKEERIDLRWEKTQIKDELEKQQDVEPAQFLNGPVVIAGELVTKTNYEKNIFITKNRETIIKQLEYTEFATLSEDEKKTIETNLRNIFGKNYEVLSAFIITALIGNVEGARPILFFENMANSGKTLTASIIKKIVEGGNISMCSLVDFTKNLSSFANQRIPLLDDVDPSQKEDWSQVILWIKTFSTAPEAVEIPKRYSQTGEVVNATVFPILTTVEDIYENTADQQIITRSLLVRIETNADLISFLQNDKFILKARGFYIQKTNEFLKHTFKKEEKKIKKRYITLMKVARFLDEKYGTDIFSDLNADEDTGEKIPELLKDFLEFAATQKQMKKSELFEAFCDEKKAAGEDVKTRYSTHHAFFRKFNQLGNAGIIDTGERKYRANTKWVKAEDTKKKYCSFKISLTDEDDNEKEGQQSLIKNS